MNYITGGASKNLTYLHIRFIYHNQYIFMNWQRGSKNYECWNIIIGLVPVLQVGIRSICRFFLFNGSKGHSSADVQQPSAECTAIFTVHIVKHRQPSCAVTIHKTCTGQCGGNTTNTLILVNRPRRSDAIILLLCSKSQLRLIKQ